MASFLQIQELSHVVRTFGDKTSKSLFQPNQKKSRLRLLARKFAMPGETNEAAFAGEICHTGEHDHLYVQLRSKLKRRLIGRLFHLDMGNTIEVRKAIYWNAREIFCIRTLLMVGSRQVAIWLIPRALARARRYELTQDRIELLGMLRVNAMLNGDRKKFALCTSELEAARAVRSAETRLTDLEEEINVELAATANPNEKAQSLSVSSAAEAETLFRIYPTFNVGLSHYRLSALASEIAGDYWQTLALCDQAEQFLTRHPRLAAPVYIGQFAVKQLTSAVATRNIEGTRSALERCASVFPDRYNNWFIWKEMEFVFYLHTREWQQALELHREIVSHARFGTQPESVAQKWALYKLYGSFAASQEGIMPLPQRKFSRILREVPLLTRDKAGYNASLYILQYLILVSRGDLGGLDAKSEAIEKYVTRYLRGQTDRQLYGFLKTLIILRKLDFDVTRTSKRARRYIALFHRFGHEKIDETQALPFDLMWTWLSEWVKTRVKPKVPI
jgi:hypothetical protein